jgi:hypothetical protein
VTHACNLSYLGGGDKADHGSSQKVENPSQSVIQAWWGLPAFTGTEESQVEGLRFEAGPGQKVRPYLKRSPKEKRFASLALNFIWCFE